MRVEYLIIVSADNQFATNRKTFESLLQSNAGISIIKSDQNEAKIKFKEIEFDYNIQFGNVELDKRRYVHLKMSIPDEEVHVDYLKEERNVEVEYDFNDILEKFFGLLRIIRELINKVYGVQPQEIWNDTSYYYSIKAYPLLHNIENIMRKLITKFMLVNVGPSWTADAIPENLKKDSRTSNIENNNNYLYEIDFIQLSEFLFNKYRTLDAKGLTDSLRTMPQNSTNEELLKRVQDFIPESNWERYFQNLVECEGDFLNSRWSRLYKLRCKIAHNNSFNKNDLEQVIKIVEEIRPKLISAIDNLDKIEVPENEKDELAESIAVNTKEIYGAYIIKWNELMQEMGQYAENLRFFDSNTPLNSPKLFAFLKHLIKEEWDGANKSLWKNFEDAQRLRNLIVHATPGVLEDTYVMEGLARLEHLEKWMVMTLPPF